MPSTRRSESLKAAREASFARWFAGRRWRIATEESGTEEREGGVKIVYERGEFWVQPPGKFQTPLGHKGRHGYVLQEVDPHTGQDIEGSRSTWGAQALRKAREQYRAIIDGQAAGA